MEMKIYNCSEAAKILRIGKKKMYELIHANQINHVDLGYKFVLTDKAIYEFINSKERRNGNERTYTKKR